MYVPHIKTEDRSYLIHFLMRNAWFTSLLGRDRCGKSEQDVVSPRGGKQNTNRMKMVESILVLFLRILAIQ